MDSPLLAIGAIVLGYLIGSLPMGVIVARVTGGTDPRSVGSGRTGGTNALRAMGWPRAVLVGGLDLAKGAIPILLAGALGAPVEVQALTGVAAVLGSWKSIFLRFHGGRGVAAGVGGMLAIDPVIAVLAAPVFFGVIVTTRYVSLGSLLATSFGGLVALVFVLLGWLPAAWLLYVVPGLGIVWLAHVDNIARLRAGTERRFDPSDRQAVSTSDPPGEAQPPP